MLMAAAALIPPFYIDSDHLFYFILLYPLFLIFFGLARARAR